jgi:general secretion pathway protein G
LEVFMNNKGKRDVLKSSAGFTLIELMVVMIILGLLAALVVPRMFGRVGEAKQKAAYTQIQLFGTALDSFRLDTGRYPTTSEGLESLIAQASGVDDWNGPYLKKTEVPLDPWNNPYYYESPGKHSDNDLISFGADKTEGGEKENMDIVSWKGLR